MNQEQPSYQKDNKPSLWEAKMRAKVGDRLGDMMMARLEYLSETDRPVLQTSNAAIIEGLAKANGTTYSHGAAEPHFYPESIEQPPTVEGSAMTYGKGWLGLQKKLAGMERADAQKGREYGLERSAAREIDNIERVQNHLMRHGVNAENEIGSRQAYEMILDAITTPTHYLGLNVDFPIPSFIAAHDLAEINSIQHVPSHIKTRDFEHLHYNVNPSPEEFITSSRQERNHFNELQTSYSRPADVQEIRKLESFDKYFEDKYGPTIVGIMDLHKGPLDPSILSSKKF